MYRLSCVTAKVSVPPLMSVQAGDSVMVKILRVNREVVSFWVMLWLTFSGPFFSTGEHSFWDVFIIIFEKRVGPENYDIVL